MLEEVIYFLVGGMDEQAVVLTGARFINTIIVNSLDDLTEFPMNRLVVRFGGFVEAIEINGKYGCCIVVNWSIDNAKVAFNREIDGFSRQFHCDVLPFISSTWEFLTPDVLGALECMLECCCVRRISLSFLL